MSKNIKVLGIITARGGSKGIPRKNILHLSGEPLISYTIKAASRSKQLSRVLVSTEDKEIAEISKKYGADVPFFRPAELAQDNSTSIEVVQYVLKKLMKDDNEEYDYVMILQPTSPLRTEEDIDRCIKIAKETEADSVMSMVEIDDFSAIKIKKIRGGHIKPFFKKEGISSARRQDQEKAYRRNCAIYLTKTSYIIKGDLFGKDSRAYIMPEERSIDINRPVDFELAEYWLNKIKK